MKKNVEFLYFCASKRHMVIILVQHTVHVFEDPEAKSEGKKIGKIEAVCMTTICDSMAAAQRWRRTSVR